MTATPTDTADTSIDIEILNGSTEVENGEEATWSEGDNTLTVTVSGNGSETVYTVTVTYTVEVEGEGD